MNLRKVIQNNLSYQNTNEDILINNDSYENKLKENENKKQLSYLKKNNFPIKIRRNLVLRPEDKFNPITQRFLDKNKDNEYSNFLNEEKLNLIANSYDKQLEIEKHPYDIITLQNKFKTLNYDEEKLLPKNSIIFNRNKNQNNFKTINAKPYNIISNLSIKKHNNLPPSLFPDNDDSLKKCKEGLFFADKKSTNMSYVQKKYTKDYNILSNEYKVFNKEKLQTEREIQNLKAMKKMQNLKTYDLIKGKFINPNLENEYLKNISIRQKNQRDKNKDKKYILLNPLNNFVYNKEVQKKLDDINYAKKKRYIGHQNIENYYHSRDNNIDTHKIILAQSHENALENKTIQNRGYNIVSCSDFVNSNLLKNKGKSTDKIIKNKSNEKYYLDNWNKIKLQSNSNNTFDKKDIYKQMYDYSDININYDQFLRNKREYLSKFSSNTDNFVDKNGKINNFEIRNKIKDNFGNERQKTMIKSVSSIAGRTDDIIFGNNYDDLVKKSDNKKMDKNKFFGNYFYMNSEPNNYNLSENLKTIN